MKDFIVAYRNETGSYTYSHSESSYSEAAISIPSAGVDDVEYIVICPPGFVHTKSIVEPIEPQSLPY